MDKIGRKQTMTLGFVLWSIMAFIIGAAINPLQKIFPLFVVLYGIFNTLGEMGPGVSCKRSPKTPPQIRLLTVSRSQLFCVVPNLSRLPSVVTSSVLPPL